MVIITWYYYVAATAELSKERSLLISAYIQVTTFTAAQHLCMHVKRKRCKSQPVMIKTSVSQKVLAHNNFE